MKKVLLTKDRLEKNKDLDWTKLEAFDDMTIYEKANREEQKEYIKDAEILLAEGVRLDRDLLDHGKNLKYIIILSTGYNSCDLDYCNERGILVSNIPTYGTDIVAQYTMALLLEICHRIGLHSDYVKEGGWQKKGEKLHWQRDQILLNGKSLGIIGYGRIGKAVGKIAKAFGMELITAGRKPEDQKRVFREADIISLHCNLTEENHNLIDEEAIGTMKDGVIIINTARGGLIDEKALYQGLKSGKIHGAALDVSKKEPIEKDNPLLSLDSILQTPHMAWGAPEARQRILDQAADTIEEYVKGTPIHVVSE
ncbi:MAG: NAD(P)-dependent oxidoreductase [Tissierellia bacterium]|nr:NAD(P)-dependent oxidoreductase [Tissierellia bacterium]